VPSRFAHLSECLVIGPQKIYAHFWGGSLASRSWPTSQSGPKSVRNYVAGYGCYTRATGALGAGAV
jgi:hypothetical protein